MLMVVTAEGFFYQYNVDTENGGECALVKEFALVEEGEEGGS